MLLRKPSILIFYSHTNGLLPISSSGPSKTSLPLPSQRAQPPHRQYAMVSNGHSKHDHGSLRWPEKTTANAVPSPYQIFNMTKTSKYSKERFYELVKIYHPDKHDHAEGGLSYATKLERYRLVVAANDLLSDPVRKGAFDRYGAGWNGQPDVIRPQDATKGREAWGGRGWHSGPDGPSQNATWEDWEKWYQRDSEGPQSPRFVSNTAFVFLVVMFAIIGGVGQATRVSNYSMNFIEQRDALHSDISHDLMRRRKETVNGFATRDERIQSFLKQKAPIGYDQREEEHQKLLPAPNATPPEKT